MMTATPALIGWFEVMVYGGFMVAVSLWLWHVWFESADTPDEEEDRLRW